jgi:hypothetical protein
MRRLWTRACRPRLCLVIAGISVVALAASSPIYSAVHGSHVTGHTSPLAVATADCSKAAATEIVLRLHLNDPEVADPVGKVLCGAFTGPGSQTMVVSLIGPGNTGLIDWVVFRWAEDAWQFLMKQPAAASITTAGPDIRQTLPVYRPDDARCCPTGGTKTRIWHWNGTRFVAGPWKQLTKGKVVTESFYTPSKNITCSLGDSTDFLGVSCVSFKAPQTVRMDPYGRLRICHGRRCLGCGCAPEGIPTLGYGKQVAAGRFRCLSRRSGVTCTVIRSGKGFLITRAGVLRVGS